MHSPHAHAVIVDKMLWADSIAEGDTIVMTASSMKPATRDRGKLLTICKK